MNLTLKTAWPVLLAFAVAACAIVPGMRAGQQTAPHADMTRLPASLGDWQLAASETTQPDALALPPAALAALDLDSYTQRVYKNTRTGRAVSLLLEYRTAGRGAFNHRPEACYPAVGFSLTGRKVVPIRYGPRPASAVAWTADYSGQGGRSHQQLLYWFASGGICESSFWRQQWAMAFGRLHPQTNGWAFVRLSAEAVPGHDAQALADEQSFAAAASASLVQILTTH